MACSHYKVNNLIVILDYNKLQVSGSVNKVMNIEPVVKKFRAFGWNTLEIDGHNMIQVVKALQKAKNNLSYSPIAIISHSIKGKGIPFIEGKVEWHSHNFSEEDYQRANRALTRECF